MAPEAVRSPAAEAAHSRIKTALNRAAQRGKLSDG
jgi:hypothetical protein